MAKMPLPAFRASVERIAEMLSTPGSVMEKRLMETIATNLKKETGRGSTPGQRAAWTNSLPVLFGDLMEAGLGEVEALIEVPMPGNKSTQADVVLAGVDHDTGGDTYLAIELKQWRSADLFEDDLDMVIPSTRFREPVTHPVIQAEQYCEHLRNHCGALQEAPHALSGVVYLHNAPRQNVRRLFDLAGERDVQLFTLSERGAFLDYLQSRFSKEAGAKAADRLLSGTARPGRHLLAQAADSLKGRNHFVLLGRQNDAFRRVMHEVEQSYRANTKRVVVITGGPGSGKSAIAIELLAALSRENQKVLFATGSQALTETLRRHAGWRSKAIKDLFVYFSAFTRRDRYLDVIIADESHRLRSKTLNWRQPALGSDRPQIEDIIESCRVPVFLLDEHQVVRPGEVGTIAAIKAQAQQLDVRFTHISLEGQWRCGGSADYDEWVRRLLGLGTEDSAWDGTGPKQWTKDPAFEVVLATSPEEMERALREKVADEWSARMTAGFCWPWTKPDTDAKTLTPDVKIGEWARPWNANSTTWVGEAPPKALWATEEGGFEQIGCIYTAQGMEFDWAGVIIGPDLVARGGKLVVEREACKDGELTKKGVTHERFDRLIRNTYKVLLTRGLRGVVVYAVDPETQGFLSELIGGPPAERGGPA